MNRTVSELERDRRFVIESVASLTGVQSLRAGSSRGDENLARLERAARDGLHAAAAREVSPSQAMAIGAFHCRLEALAEARSLVSACPSSNARSAALSRLEESARRDVARAVAEGNGLQEFSMRVRVEAFAEARAALDGLERDRAGAEEE